MPWVQRAAGDAALGRVCAERGEAGEEATEQTPRPRKSSFLGKAGMNPRPPRLERGPGRLRGTGAAGGVLPRPARSRCSCQRWCHALGESPSLSSPPLAPGSELLHPKISLPRVPSLGLQMHPREGDGFWFCLGMLIRPGSSNVSVQGAERPIRGGSGGATPGRGWGVPPVLPVGMGSWDPHGGVLRHRAGGHPGGLI